MFDSLFGKDSSLSSLSTLASLLGESSKVETIVKVLPMIKELAITPDQVSTIMGLATKELNLPEFLDHDTIKTFGELFKLIERLMNPSSDEPKKD